MRWFRRFIEPERRKRDIPLTFIHERYIMIYTINYKEVKYEYC
ncbi:MAG: hypothetical protein V1872_00180 [bacterium]